MKRLSPIDRRRVNALGRRREERRLRRLRALKSRATVAAGAVPFSRLLASFAPRRDLSRFLPRAQKGIRIPTVFSFIENPEETLKAIQNFAGELNARPASVVWVDQSGSKKIDLCAESVAGVLAEEARKRFGTRFNGVFPTDPEQQEIIRATGMPRYLGLVRGEAGGYEKFDLKRGRKSPARAHRSTEKEVTTGTIVEYLNRCLRHYEWELDSDTEDIFGEIVGEVIANAEDHSGTADWWIAGYLRQPLTHGDCHLVVFNFGETIYDSLRSLPPSSRLRSDIESRVERHTRAGLFQKSAWTPEDLWTVYALQEAVSRYNDQPNFLGHRGMGTVKMIEFFQSVAPSDPRMCVLSGRTHILFDGTYRMGYQHMSGGGRRRVIAFNRENNLDLAPDPRYVRHLKRGFPGTLISLSFNFDKSHLDQIGRR